VDARERTEHLRLGRRQERQLERERQHELPSRHWAGCSRQGAPLAPPSAAPRSSGRVRDFYTRTAQASRPRIDSIEGGRSPERSRRSEDTPEAHPPRIEEAARRTTRVRDEGTLRRVPLRDYEAPSRAAHAASMSARGGPRRGDRARHAINRSANPSGFSKRPPVPGQIAPRQGPTLRAYSPVSAPNDEARCNSERSKASRRRCLAGRAAAILVEPLQSEGGEIVLLCRDQRRAARAA
jgi:hypothetical protein